MRQECYFCHTKTIKTLIEKFKPNKQVADRFLSETGKLLNNDKELTNPVLATEIHRTARKLINHSNLYQEEKQSANTILMEQYADWKDLVNKSSNPLYTAVKLAVAGNIIDYGAHVVPEDIVEHVQDLLNKRLAVDKTQQLFTEIHRASSILYIGDNAGEIVFDKLFIETMKHNHVTFAVRGKPVINDVTMEDAIDTGMNSICKIVSNGYDAPSTLLAYCSDEFIQLFKKSDLIIAKGQGNFEGLMDTSHPNLFFMLMAKCEPIAEMIGVNKGDMLVMRSTKTV